MDIHFFKNMWVVGRQFEWIAHVLHLLWADVLTAFDVDYVFKDVYVVNSLWRERKLFLSGAKDKRAHYKRFWFPRLRLPIL